MLIHFKHTKKESISLQFTLINNLNTSFWLKWSFLKKLKFLFNKTHLINFRLLQLTGLSKEKLATSKTKDIADPAGLLVLQLSFNHGLYSMIINGIYLNNNLLIVHTIMEIMDVMEDGLQVRSIMSETVDFKHKISIHIQLEISIV